MQAFLKSFNAQQSQLSVKDLSSRIGSVKKLVRKYFFPSTDSKATAEEEFNYELYTHFKAYNEILVEKKVPFPRFNADFQRVIGKRLLELVIPMQTSFATLAVSKEMKEQLNNALKAADTIGTLLVDSGIITSWERSVPSKEDVEDFVEPYLAPASDNFSVASDLKFTLALNVDVTLNSQLLLQELGYRLYPSFGRWLLQESLLSCFQVRESDQKRVIVNIDDYYMDTSYNSNPDLFEVRQILLNVVLERN